MQQQSSDTYTKSRTEVGRGMQAMMKKKTFGLQTQSQERNGDVLNEQSFSRVQHCGVPRNPTDTEPIKCTLEHQVGSTNFHQESQLLF